jgi:hypothetical protein
MYAAVRRYEGITDDAEAGRLVRESFLPQLDDIPGFIAYYWVDAGNGTMASLSVFEDKEGADKSVDLAHDWIVENAPNLFPNPPQVTEGLVVASELASVRAQGRSAWRRASVISPCNSLAFGTVPTHYLQRGGKHAGLES